MTVEGVDYAWSRPDPAQLYAAGKRFASRYVGPGSDGKHLHPDEAQALAAAGLSIVANAEGSAGGALGGWSTGVDHAQSAHTMAVACGMPADRPIYFSVDFEVSAEQWPVVKAYLDGAASVVGRRRVGVYGGYWTIRMAADGGWAGWFWQTFAWSIWADGDGVSRVHWHPAAHVQQYKNGVSIAGADSLDLDRAVMADFGQWGVDMDAEQIRWLNNLQLELSQKLTGKDYMDAVVNLAGATQHFDLPEIKKLNQLQADMTAVKAILAALAAAGTDADTSVLLGKMDEVATADRTRDEAHAAQVAALERQLAAYRAAEASAARAEAAALDQPPPGAAP